MMSKEAMKLALGKIKSARDCHPNAVDTLLFEAEEILEEARAKPDFWEGYVPEPVKPRGKATLAQQEPDWLDKEQTETDWDHVWLLIKAASYASSKGFVSGTTNWGSAVSRYMRNESPQPAQQEPVAWTSPHGGFLSANYINNFASGLDKEIHNIPLYTSPPAQRTWVGLTDEELSEVYNQADWDTVNGWEYERAIEAKLRSKNEDRN